MFRKFRNAALKMALGGSVLFVTLSPSSCQILIQPLDDWGAEPVDVDDGSGDDGFEFNPDVLDMYYAL